MRCQLQIADHFRPQHAGDVRGGRGAAARRDFFRHTTAAHNVAPLEHQRGQACAAQVGSGGEAVVAGSNDNHVVLRQARHKTMNAGCK